MLTYGSATRSGGGWDSGDCLTPPLLARSQKHLFRLYIVTYTDIYAGIFVYCKFFFNFFFRRLFKDLRILWVYLKGVQLENSENSFSEIYTHTYRYICRYICLRQKDGLSPPPVAGLAHFVGIVGNFGKFLWSFLSPPCGRTCAFCGDSWKGYRIVCLYHRGDRC